ncbi:MAG: Na+/H+ antiporter subunit E [Sedimenticola sp.]|nr:Na+/H+ antiporter subunit E [Sedimenticola sp.]
MNRTTRVYSILLKVVLLALVWWVLSDGNPHSWWIGGMAIVLALLAAKSPTSQFSISLLKLTLFIPFFLKHSILGGVDVARRALRPAMPIDPIMVDCVLRLPPGPPQVLLTNMVSLLPGTLSASLENNVLTMHVLDKQGSYANDFLVLEEKIAELFSVPVLSPGAGV